MERLRVQHAKLNAQDAKLNAQEEAILELQQELAEQRELHQRELAAQDVQIAQLFDRVSLLMEMLKRRNDGDAGASWSELW